MIKSRTIRVMLIMAAFEAALAVSHTWEPIMTDSTFIIISSILGIITPMLGVYMRMITTVPLSDK